MKEVKREVARTIKETFVGWEAVDGTFFDDRQECEKYEKSAKGVLRAKLKALTVNEPVDAWTLMGGMDDHQVIGVHMKTQEDVDVVLQSYYLDQPELLTDCDYGKRNKAKFLSLVDQAYRDNDLLLFGLNCDNELYIINTRENIIKNLFNLDKKEETNV